MGRNVKIIRSFRKILLAWFFRVFSEKTRAEFFTFPQNEELELSSVLLRAKQILPEDITEQQ